MNGTDVPLSRLRHYQPSNAAGPTPEREPPAKAPLRFQVFRPRDLEALDPTEEVAVLSDRTGPIWLKGSAALVLGGAGIGKSRWVFSLAVADILERDFCGFQTAGAGRWLFISPENSALRVRKDLMRITAGQNLSLHDWEKLNENLRFAPFSPGTEMPPTDVLNGRDALRAMAEEHKPDVVVVDPWEEFLSGDSNDAGDTRSSFARLQGIFPNSTLLIVHHAREGAEAVKSATGFNATAFGKGSKSLVGRVRLAFNLTPLHPATETAEKGHGLVINCGKANDSRGFAARAVTFNDTDGSYIIDGSFDATAYRLDVDGKRTKKTLPLRAVIEIVRRGITKKCEISAALLSDGLDASSSTLKRALEDATTAKLLVRLKHGTYELGPEADKLCPSAK